MRRLQQFNSFADTSKELYQKASMEMAAFLRSQNDREDIEKDLREAWDNRYQVCS